MARKLLIHDVHYLAIATKTSLMRVHLLGRALTIIDMRNRAAREKRHFGKFLVYNPACRQPDRSIFWISSDMTVYITLQSTISLDPTK